MTPDVIAVRLLRTFTDEAGRIYQAGERLLLAPAWAARLVWAGHARLVDSSDLARITAEAVRDSEQ